MFRPITSAAPSPTTGGVAANPVHEQQSKETSPGSSLPCGQGTPTTPTSSQIQAPQGNNTTPQGACLNNLQAHTQPQNVAPQQPSVPTPGFQQPLPVAPQQESPLFQPQFPNPNAVPAQPQFTQPHVTPQASPIRQQSPIRTQANLFSQHSIPAPEANVLSTPEQRIPKSINGEGVKNSRKQGTASTSNAPDGRLCFQCRQPGHLKKDCTELPYCSKCKMRGHIPAKCPVKQQNGRQQDERCESAGKRCKTHRGLEESTGPTSAL